MDGGCSRSRSKSPLGPSGGSRRPSSTPPTTASVPLAKILGHGVNDAWGQPPQTTRNGTQSRKPSGKVVFCAPIRRRVVPQHARVIEPNSDLALYTVHHSFSSRSTRLSQTICLINHAFQWVAH